MNEDSFDSNPIENEWIQFCVSAAINDEKCSSKEFEEWLSSQDLEKDSIYSILSHSDDTTVKPDSQDRSHELDCVAFHEYPLTENDLLSQHKQWRIIDDKIFEGDVLLFLSDGILSAFGSAADAADFLCRERPSNPQALAEEIVAEGKRRTGGRAEDDMTALAVRLFKKEARE